MTFLLTCLGCWVVGAFVWVFYRFMSHETVNITAIPFWFIYVAKGLWEGLLEALRS